jgi:hypothetical protein
MKNKKRIYISGKISGISLEAAAEKFAGDQEMLEELEDELLSIAERSAE